jgi:phosphate:Na+ symporter
MSNIAIQFSFEETGAMIWALLQLLGALALFIYGMKLMSEGIQKIAGLRLRRILSGMTDKPIKGIFTGFVTTGLIQSSSATTVMTISFVNAGLISLTESFGLIMGANIGTTLTSWIVNYLGLHVQIQPFAMVLIGLAFPFMFSNRGAFQDLSKAIVGFGVLFIGLEFLKGSVPDLNDPANAQLQVFLSSLTDLGYGSTLIFVFLGALLTVVVQSSSAATTLTLIMLANGWISFPLGAAMVLGENIGTTLTVNIAAVVANNKAKRAARFHFLFNLIGAAWMLIALNPVLNLLALFPFEHEQKIAVNEISVSSYIESQAEKGQLDDEVIRVIPRADSDGYMLVDGYGPWTELMESGERQASVMVDSPNDRLPLFHTLFNVLNVGLLLSFLPLMERLTKRLVPESSEENEEDSLLYIGSGLLQMAELSLEEARSETQDFGRIVQRIYSNTLSLYFEPYVDEEGLREKIRRREEITDDMEIRIADFLTRLSKEDVSASSSRRIQALLGMINDLERVADICFDLSLSHAKMKEQSLRMPEEVAAPIKQLMEMTFQRIKDMNRDIVLGPEQIDMDNAREQENAIDQFSEQINKQLFDALEKGKINALQSIAFLNVVKSIERIADHVMNMYEAMSGEKE